MDIAATKAVIDVAPDQRFLPVCHLGGNKATATVHSLTQRSVRDLNPVSAQVWPHCEYRTTTEIYPRSIGDPERHAMQVLNAGLEEVSHADSHTEKKGISGLSL